jgi:hypothetical protein
MMNTHKATFFLALVFLLVLTVSVASQPSDNIIVNGADEVRETSVSLAQGLRDSLTQVPARVVVQYANTIHGEDLAALPSALQTLLGQVSERIILQYANTNRQESLVYPVALINDTTPPQISDIVASLTGSDSATITWTTDEFADSQVMYGTQPGVHPQTMSDRLYSKEHRIILTGLAEGATYYCQVRSTDRSGNTTTSLEQSFTVQLAVYVYLPVVMRSRP